MGYDGSPSTTAARPRSDDRVGLLSTYPSPALVVSRFGSWSTALRKAGLEPGNPPPVTDREICARCATTGANIADPRPHRTGNAQDADRTPTRSPAIAAPGLPRSISPG